MQLTIFATYEEANQALDLPRDAGPYGDLKPVPKLDPDVHPEQYSCVVFVRKWSYEGNKGTPDLSFIGLECVDHLTDGHKWDLFIYARMDGHDSKN